MLYNIYNKFFCFKKKLYLCIRNQIIIVIMSHKVKHFKTFIIMKRSKKSLRSELVSFLSSYLPSSVLASFAVLKGPDSFTVYVIPTSIISSFVLRSLVSFCDSRFYGFYVDSYPYSSNYSIRFVVYKRV